MKNKTTFLLTILLFCCTWQNFLSAQALACNSQINISYDAVYTCFININDNDIEDIFLEGEPCTGCDLELKVYATELDFQNNNPLETNQIGGEYAGTTMYYSVEDLNTGNLCWGILMPEDKMSPIATCIANLQVEMPNTGALTIWANDFDAGSYDSCSDIDIAIRRVDEVDCAGNAVADFADSITFESCENNSAILIEMRVTDASGNTNSCWTNLHIGTGGSVTTPVSLIASHETGNVSDEVCVDISVADFTDITGFQFTVAWDAEDLEYTGLQNFNSNLPALGPASFSTVGSNNTIRVSWYSLTTEPYTLADTAVLFSVCYTILSDETPLTDIRFENEPILIEFTGDIDVVEHIFYNGSVNGTSLPSANTPNIIAPADTSLSCGTSLSEIEIPNIVQTGDYFPIYYVHQDNPPLSVYNDLDDIELLGFYTQAWDDLDDAMDIIYVHDEVDESDPCGMATIERIFTIVGGTQTVQATQVITFEGSNVFDESYITWPQDVTQCDPTVPAGEPLVEVISCSLTAMAYEDTFITDNGNITKVLRNWTVVDWCSGGVWEHLQVIELSEGDCVWPGDTNDDGEANHFDLLNLALGYDAMGAARSNTSNNWVGQAAANWADSFTDSLNYKHADCDGNGVIDSLDLLPIQAHWGNTHNFTEAHEDNLLDNEDRDELSLFMVVDTVEAGAAVSLPIHLGLDETEWTDAYGLAFSVHYEKEKIVASSAQMNFSESWIGVEDETMITIQKDFWNEGRIDLAFSRNDGQNMAGFGKVCALDIIIEDVIFLNSSPFGDLEDVIFSIENIRIINSEGEEIPVETSPAVLKVEPSTTGTQQALVESIKVFPNPTTSIFQIEIPETTINQMNITDINGTVLKSYQNRSSSSTFELADLPKGVYFVHIQTAEHLYMAKLLIQ